MTKKKSFISLLLAFCLIVPAMFMLTACGLDNTLPKLSNDTGIEIVGEFEEGSKLNTNKVESTATNYDEIFVKLEGSSIKITDKSKAIIYDIFVSKDDKKVQPNGKVTVSVPVAETTGGYKVFHIKDNNTVEELTATYKDGILTFETSSFSYYVFVSTDAVDINPTPSDNDDTPTAESIWDSAIDYWKKATNIKVVKNIVTPQSYDASYGNMGAQVMIYQFEDGAYSSNGYFDNAEESKGMKSSYYVNEGGVYSSFEWNPDAADGAGAWIKSSYGAQDMYEYEIKHNIYGCTDFSAQKIDFDYKNFTYDETSGSYKNEDESIVVKFIFNNNELESIGITETKSGDGGTSTSVSTITFNAVVEVPTTNIIDQTASK